MALRLINAHPSPYGRKVAIALREKGIAYDVQYDEPWGNGNRARCAVRWARSTAESDRGDPRSTLRSTLAISPSDRPCWWWNASSPTASCPH